MSPLLRRLALTSLIANVAIVVTGGAVRLTGSGMGCPTWPRCTDASYTATREMGVHGAIEFGNRLLSIAVGLIAVALVLVAWRARRRGPSALLGYAAAVLALVVAQGVVGGISVRVHLDPWVVGAHFLLSMVLLALGYALWRRSAEASAPVADPSVPPSAVPGPLRSLTWVLAAASFLVLVAGTVVTGGGPHSGDPEAGRNGLDPETVSQIHADLVFLLLGLTVALWFALRATGAPAAAVRAAAVLLAVELSQGVVGFVQYFTHLPVVLVGLHMLGACLVWLATLAVVAAVQPASTRPTPAPSIGHAADRDLASV